MGVFKGRKGGFGELGEEDGVFSSIGFFTRDEIRGFWVEMVMVGDGRASSYMRTQVGKKKQREEEKGLCLLGRKVLKA